MRPSLGFVSADRPAHGRTRWLLFAAGLAISLVMSARAQIELDQYVLIVRGWMWAAKGWIVPFGALTAAGGFQPGGLTSVLMGAPLMVWEDYRAIGLLTIATHVVAYLVLDEVLKDVLGPRGRLLLCVVYWLNPWRIFYSAHAWNPNLVFLPGALHLSTAFRSRHQRSFIQSFLHVLAVGLAFQLHASFLMLALASALLFARRYVRVHWGGFAVGVIVAVGSLAGWVAAVARYPGILPLGKGSLGSGLLRVEPVAEGLLYWLRYPTAACSSKLTDFDFGPILGEHWDAVLTPFASGISGVIGVVSLGLSLVVNVWLWRRRGRRRPLQVSKRVAAIDWLLGYARWVLVAMAVVLALNPVTTSTPTSVSGTTSWRGFIVLHAATLPMIIWLALAGRTRRGRRLHRWILAYSAGLLIVGAAMAVAAPMYRKGGRDAHRCVLREPHEMLDALGVSRRATVVFDPATGFASELLDGPEALERPAPFPRM